MILKICFFFAFVIVNANPQNEKGFWGKANVSYELKEELYQRDYSFKSSDPAGLLVEGFTKSYWFLISDLDGDNCPFRPSCSEYFIESVKQTNIVTGTLMFFDRFTRDLNFIDRHVHYERTPEGYFKDPPDNSIY